MSITSRESKPSEMPLLEVPHLTREETVRAAEHHLGTIAQHERVTASAWPVTTFWRTRHAGRRIFLWVVWLQEQVRRVLRYAVSPQHPVGRAIAHARLLDPRQTFNAWAVGSVVLGAVAGVLTFWPRTSWPGTIWHSAPERAVSGGLFGSAVLGLIAMLWTDLFRCPYAVWRIRRRIVKEPESMLLVNLGAREADVVPRNDPLKIVARREFYYDVLPGVLARDHKDMQIVVGDPGAGKTTALLGLASLLSRIGMVPVLVPLRTEQAEHLVGLAKTRFCKQIEGYVRSSGEAEVLWSWLRRRRRVAILADDLDQIGPDGERGFVLRQTLLEAGTYGLPIIATARPAGVPAGIAASAVSLEPLDEQEIVEKVVEGARTDPGFKPEYVVPRQWLEDWVREGNLVEVPFYLELLAQLAAAGECPKLPDAESLATEAHRPGSYRLRPDGHFEWNPLWVRFRLLQLFDKKARSGRIRPWLGIEARERESALQQLRRSALGSLAATGLAARADRHGRADRERERPERMRLEDFINPDDRRREPVAGDDEMLTVRGDQLRRQVSVHEVTDTGERLRILDRDDVGKLQFRHRIMQAFLAGCCLAERLGPGTDRTQEGDPDWIDILLDRHHPEKLTANMALTFAALYADDQMHDCDGAAAAHDRDAWQKVGARIITRLVEGSGRRTDTAVETRPASPSAVVSMAHDDGEATTGIAVALYSENGAGDDTEFVTGPDDLDPTHFVDPDLRSDPDDALIRLTAAADVARAINCPCETDGAGIFEVLQPEIVKKVEDVRMTTRWTKLSAIRAISALSVKTRWLCIWGFAADPDYAVRRAASDALQADATRAYCALEHDIHELIIRAAARSAYDLDLTRPERAQSWRRRRFDIGAWDEDTDIPKLRALGWILPSIVSGMREDPAMHLAGAWGARTLEHVHKPDRCPLDDTEPPNAATFDAYTRGARLALERLVALTFEGGHHDLEESLAQGFKTDAMRHAASRRKSGTSATTVAGPGWVGASRRLVADVGLTQAESWYARLLLYQALALYTIAGAEPHFALDAFYRHLRRGGRERHPFTQRAARFARAGLRRGLIGSTRWRAYVWPDESEVAGRRTTSLDSGVAQLVGDVTVLLDLGEGSSEDSRRPFGYMQELPYCLSASKDRREILGTGCPGSCGWGLCPYKQPPPDEPNAHRGVSRAFCRQERQIARWRKPAWHRTIRRRRLREFWREMEQRART